MPRRRGVATSFFFNDTILSKYINTYENYVDFFNVWTQFVAIFPNESQGDWGENDGVKELILLHKKSTFLALLRFVPLMIGF